VRGFGGRGTVLINKKGCGGRKEMWGGGVRDRVEDCGSGEGCCA